MVEFSTRRSSGSSGRKQPERDSTNLVSRNVIVNGRRTSLRLEPEMWEALDEIAKREAASINDLVAFVDRNRDRASLTSDVRIFIVRYFRSATTERGHATAGHGILFDGGVTSANGTSGSSGANGQDARPIRVPKNPT